jgi:uncharacterized protein YacL
VNITVYTLIIRVLFVLFSAIIGYLAGPLLNFLPYSQFFGAFIGVLLSILVIFGITWAKKNEIKTIITGTVGLLLGIIAANILSYTLIFKIFTVDMSTVALYILINILLAYLGAGVGIIKGDEISLNLLKSKTPEVKIEENYKILDTSVIIDGRIADLCETGFIEGTILIPQFVLRELQHIADSSDSIKRTRGRRGLDILHKLQKQLDLDVEVVDIDFPKIKEVDSKLIALAQKNKGKIITNDFNLNKVAELQGIHVLNINQLANALKPVVLPGEVMNVRVLKEGKEEGQGVAYLDDGTMVVVDNARQYLGKNIDVSVTSVLQTTAGRMIFSVLKGEGVEKYIGNAGH